MNQGVGNSSRTVRAASEIRSTSELYLSSMSRL